jgi:hypothetical protein
MALQTFTAGQILTAAQVTALQANDYNQTVSAKVASYTLVAADKGTRITMSSASATTVTVNTGLFTAGDSLRIQNLNGGGTCTVTAGTATVTSAGSLVIPSWGGGQLYFTSASAAVWFPDAVANGTAIFNEQQASGTAGGGFTSGSWVKRVLNTTLVNTITGCSIASSVITLPAGTFNITGYAPGFQVASHKTRLQNTSDATTTVLGMNAYSSDAASYAQTHSFLNTVVTITASKNFELQHQCQTTKATNGLGVITNLATINEVYSQIQIVQIA